ncbi:hypothetical protein M422DRAFT_777178 [Sphaerobolus stellatus SS14]|nr:hypothetical protein M422DRAFT_777178 [Sphaerobolus stellatus SS14]
MDVVDPAGEVVTKYTLNTAALEFRRRFEIVCLNMDLFAEYDEDVSDGEGQWSTLPFSKFWAGASRHEEKAATREEEVVTKELHKKRKPLSLFTTTQDKLPQVHEVGSGEDEGDDEGSEQDGMDGEEVVEKNEAAIVSGVDVAVLSNAEREPSIRLEDDSVPLSISIAVASVVPNVNGEWELSIKSEDDEDSIKSAGRYATIRSVYLSPEPVSDSEPKPDFAYPDTEDSEAYESASIISAVSSAHISPYESESDVQTDGSTLKQKLALNGMILLTSLLLHLIPQHDFHYLPISRQPQRPLRVYLLRIPHPHRQIQIQTPHLTTPNKICNSTLETILRVRAEIIRGIDAGALRTGKGESEGSNQNRNQRSARTKEVEGMDPLARMLQRKVEETDTWGVVAGRLSEETKCKLEEKLMIFELGALDEAWDGKLEVCVLEGLEAEGLSAVPNIGMNVEMWGRETQRGC